MLVNNSEYCEPLKSRFCRDFFIKYICCLTLEKFVSKNKENGKFKY